MIYIVVILLFLTLSYIYDYRGRSRYRLFYWLLILAILICISGFRYHMGGDSVRYEKYYETLSPINELTKKDFQDTRFSPAYILLSSLCKTLTPEFILIQFIEAIFVNGVFFLFIWKNTKHVFFCGLLYFIYLYIMLNMEVLREAFAVGIFLLSWPFFKEKKWIYYYLMSLLAFSFHISSLILFILPLMYVPGIRSLFVFGKRTLIIIPVLLAISFIIKYFLFDFIKLIAFTETMTERANVYSKDQLGGNVLNFSGAIGGMIRYALYPLIALYFIKNNTGRKKAKETTPIERMALLGIYASTMSIGVMILFRYINYFEIFALIVLADWMFTGVKFKDKFIKFNFVYWIIIVIPLFFTQVYIEYWTPINKSGSLRIIDMYYPYSNQFDREIQPNRKKAIEQNQRALNRR